MISLTHQPVLLQEIAAHLNLRTGTHVIDCTLGLGGHSRMILEKIGPQGRLLAIDQDAENLERAEKNLADLLRHGNKAVAKGKKNIVLVHANFSQLTALIEQYHFQPVDAILFDLGLSSPHIDESTRGFSFQKEGPLDMRFDRSQGITAAEVLNRCSEKTLAEIIRTLGEEPRAHKIARLIIAARKKKRLATTSDLVSLLPAKKHFDRIHPATRLFQALRMYVNDELGHLEKALHQAISILTPGGRIAVISYHSLEDRLTKQIFRYYTRDCICPKELPFCQCNFRKSLYLINKKPIIPSGIEVTKNPRSRSAKLRIAEKLSPGSAP